MVASMKRASIKRKRKKKIEKASGRSERCCHEFAVKSSVTIALAPSTIPLSGSPVKSIDVNLESYTMKRFSDDVIFYWRILKESKELEGILVANSTTWIGIGWRPSDLGPSCRSFPIIKDIPEPLPQPEPKSEPVNKTSKHSKPEPEPRAEPEPEPEPEPGVEGEKSIAKRRSAKADATTFGVTSRPDVDVTVQTSVTYQVSTKQGKTNLSYITSLILRKESIRRYCKMFMSQSISRRCKGHFITTVFTRVS